MIPNLGIFPTWQTINLSTLIFPAEMLIDYVCVYQRKGPPNMGYSPKEFPTEDYISITIWMHTEVNSSPCS